MFATARGRRYTETIGFAELRPYSGSMLQPAGSLTTSIVNSGSIGAPSFPFGGQGRKIRNKPCSSSSECEAGSSCGKLGQFDPSTAANNGSFPPVASHRLRIVSTDKPIESDG